MKPSRSVLLLAFVVAVSACSSDAIYTQEELDSRIEEAVAEAVANPSEATTTTTEARTTTTEAVTTTTRAPTTTTTLPDFGASDFTARVDVLESSCYGSAGANVEFEVAWAWPGDAYGTLTYEIRGLDDGAVDIASTEIVGDQYEIQSHFVGIPSCEPGDITVVPTRFRPEG